MLLLSALPLVTVFLFQTHQKNIQHKMQGQLEKKNLITITLQDNKIKWIKKGKEVWINNKMFDIKSLHHENGVYTLTGLYDNDETLLVTQLHKNQQDENTSGNKILFQLFRLLHTPFIQQPAAYFPGQPSALQYRPDKNISLPTQYIPLSTPPPQV